MTFDPNLIRQSLNNGERIPAHVIEMLLLYYESHPFRCVMEFHNIFELTIGDRPILAKVDHKDRELRKRLEEEEHQEYLDGEKANNIVEIFDALLDKIYVAYGTGITYGLPMLTGMLEVQSSNMSKLFEDGPRKTDYGKIIKGPKFEEPDLKKLIVNM